MVKIILRKLAVALALVIGLTTLVFFISRLLPGDPATLFLSPQVPPQVADHLREQFGLSKPMLQQYVSWLNGIVRGELGYSFSLHRDVTSILLETIPYTMLLATCAVFLEFLLAILSVYFLFRRQSVGLDKVFSYCTNADSFSFVHRQTDLLLHLILPVCTIAIPGAAGMSRFLKATVTQISSSEHVLFAQSQGQSVSRVYFCSVLPGAMLPVLTLGGLELGMLLAGALITEQIFSLPGMGRLTVAALFARDYPLLIGCTMTAGIVVILSNMLADILHAVIDPRIRLNAHA
ncbi:MAG: ABC transporter permease [Ignavibacteriales bacterium]|nr:ABC transporter permease [Ignavibacteriales bacterium]